jgi:hypothetical protein
MYSANKREDVSKCRAMASRERSARFLGALGRLGLRNGDE